MFNAKSWAAAFINSVEKADGQSSAQEITEHFFQLLVKKKRVRYIDSVIVEIKNLLNKKRGIVTVSAEYAFQPTNEFESAICETIKKRTCASGVELAGCVKPELIGGYRLRIGDKIIDASIRGQLHKMKASLAAGDGVN